MIINSWKKIRDENNVNLLCFVESYELGNFVIIQYNDELGKDDIEFEWSRYYFELYIGDNNQGAYSCIKEIELNQESIRFIFNGSGENEFNIQFIELYFSNILNDFEYIKTQINAIFSDDKNISILNYLLV